MDPTITRMVLWIIAGATTLTSAGMGGVLIYHWYRYSLNAFITIAGPLIYLAVTGTLLFIMISALFSL